MGGCSSKTKPSQRPMISQPQPQQHQPAPMVQPQQQPVEQPAQKIVHEPVVEQVQAAPAQVDPPTEPIVNKSKAESIMEEQSEHMNFNGLQSLEEIQTYLDKHHKGLTSQQYFTHLAEYKQQLLQSQVDNLRWSVMCQQMENSQLQFKDAMDEQEVTLSLVVWTSDIERPQYDTTDLVTLMLIQAHCLALAKEKSQQDPPCAILNEQINFAITVQNKVAECINSQQEYQLPTCWVPSINQLLVSGNIPKEEIDENKQEHSLSVVHPGLDPDHKTKEEESQLSMTCDEYEDKGISKDHLMLLKQEHVVVVGNREQLH